MQAYDTEGQLSPRRYQPGEVVTGEVVRVDEDGIVVGVGLKTEGIIPPHEMRLLGHEEQTRLQPGDSIDVTIHRRTWPRRNAYAFIRPSSIGAELG